MMVSNDSKSSIRSVEQALNLAVQQHQAGRLAEAETIYRQILQLQPNHPDALHLLGMIAFQSGQSQRAAELIRQAIDVNPSTAIYQNNLGMALRECGRLDEAAAAYHRAIELQPDYAEPHNNLGNILKDKGDDAGAIAAFENAVRLQPGFAEAHYNLGCVLQKQKQLDEAVAAFRRAITIKPNLIEAHNNLGLTLTQMKLFDEAQAAFGELLKLKPDYAEAYCGLGAVLQTQGREQEALQAYLKAVKLNPDNAEAHNNLGGLYSKRHEFAQAMAEYRLALKLKPDHAQIHHNLGMVLGQIGRKKEAEDELRLALKFQPDYVEAHNLLGVVLQAQRQYAAALASYTTALALKPDFAQAHFNTGNWFREGQRFEDAVDKFRVALEYKRDFLEAHNNLGNTYKDQGLILEAIDEYQIALRIDPHKHRVHSNLILTMHYLTDCDAVSIQQELRRWNRMHEQPLKKFIVPYANNRDAERKLRIGYVSPDFYLHVIGRVMLPLLAEHDRGNFQIYCYSSVQRPDSMTEQLSARADVWRDIMSLKNRQAAQMIRDDEIDILVDLSLHSSDNRLLIFARKPAPVQVSWLGYPGSTGMDAMDYRLTDSYVDPPGMFDAYYCEESIRLPDAHLCYYPLTSVAPSAELPANKTGGVTFGSLNNFCKVNDEILNLWAKLLAAVPDSRLLIKAPQGPAHRRVLDTLSRENISTERVEFLDRLDETEFWNIYQRIDIGLDTWPYNGFMTSMDCLWMGVPVVSLSGKMAVGRGGVSILTNVGLPELIAQTQEEYIQIAVKLASDLPRLSQFHSTLRRRIQASSLMDAPRFARNVEAAYRQIWRKWCNQQKV